MKVEKVNKPEVLVFKPVTIEITFESAHEQKLFRHLVGCGSDCSIDSFKDELAEMGSKLNIQCADLSFPA